MFPLALAAAAPAPPPNDTCAGAEVIPGAGPFPRWSSITPDITGATTTGDPPAPTDCYDGPISRSIWYQFTPAATGLYVLSLNDTATTVQDTLMGVYTSTGGCGGPFVHHACNDDVGENKSAVATNLTAHTTYYVVVWVVGTNALFAGETAVQLKVAMPQAPANDTCAGAEVIPPAGPFPHSTSTNDSFKATAAGDPPAPSCTTPGPRSVWFQFKPETAGQYVFSTCQPSATTVYDTLLALYSSPAACGSLTLVACNDDACDYRSSLTATLAAGTQYYAVVWDLEPDPNPGETAVQLRVARLGPPVIANVTAGSLASTGAVLSAVIVPNTTGFARGWFEWGTTTSYGNTAPAQILNSGIFEATLAQAIGGLTPGTVYHYRAVATNSMGIIQGTDRTFQWSNARPSLSRQLEWLADGSLRLRFPGNPGQLYRVESAATLPGTWTDLGIALDSGAGAFEFIVPSPPRNRTTFYRVRAP